MKMLIDVDGDFETENDILILINDVLNGTSFHVDILWHEEREE